MKNYIAHCPKCGAKNRNPAQKTHTAAKCGKCSTSLVNSTVTGRVVDLDDAGFNAAVKNTSLPVLVDFYSPACGPCQMLAPIITNIASEFAGKAVVGKLDTSKHSLNASRFNIRGVPTLLYFKNGQLVDQVVGAASQSDISERLYRLL